MTAHVWFPKPPGRVIDGDALSYYAWLRSLAFDDDIDFSNDYRLLTNDFAEDSAELTPLETGFVPNKSPPGSAMLSAPLFLAVGAVIALLNLIGAQIPFDGLALAFKISAGVAGIAYATAWVWLCYDLARRIYPAASAFWATITLWLGGSLLYYSLVSPTYSHATSLFAVALFYHTWYRTRGRHDLQSFALLGALAGLAGLVRSQDLIILTIPGLELLDGVRERRWSHTAACGLLAVLCIACAVVFSPQVWAWQTICGTPVLNPHGGAVSLSVGATCNCPDTLLNAPGAHLVDLPQRLNRPVVGRRGVRRTPFRQLSAVPRGRAVGVPRIPGDCVASDARALRLPLPDRQQRVFLLQYQLFMRGFTDIVAEYPNGP